jgi:hypothetical protein
MEEKGQEGEHEKRIGKDEKKKKDVRGKEKNETGEEAKEIKISKEWKKEV